MRNERRIELAFEDRRYMDLIRWKLAEKALNKPVYGLLSAQLLKERIVDNGLWFFPDTPNIDEDGIADFERLSSWLLPNMSQRHLMFQTIFGQSSKEI